MNGRKGKRGVFISFEGGEGGGKSSQILRLRERLEGRGIKVVITREPGGTVISERIREILLDKKSLEMAYTTEVLLFQAARAQVYRELIIPALEMGKWVLADRTSDSSVVYQGMVRGFGVKVIEELNRLSTKNTLPDLTFLLDVEVEVGLGRREESGKMDRLDLEGRSFHEKVKQAYLDLAKQDKTGRWVVVDANKDIEEVGRRIWEEVEKRFFKGV